jgi:general secretion pathway protein D
VEQQDMERSIPQLLTLVAFMLFTQMVCAAETTESTQDTANDSRSESTVELTSLIAEVAKTSKKKFLLEPRVPPRVTVGDLGGSKVTYPVLLMILHNNGLAAATVQGIVNVIPDVLVRQYPLPVIYKSDPSIPDFEWVTRVVRLRHSDAKHAVAVLRPLMQQSGHLVAVEPQNILLMVDCYANTERLVELLEAFDKPPVTPSGSE